MTRLFSLTCGHMRLHFAPEWGAVLALALLEIPLCWMAGLHFHLSHHDGYLFAVPLAAAALAAGAFRRLSLVFEFLALMLLTSTAMCVLAYVAVAQSGPLVDTQLLAMDRAIGFDWQSWQQLVTRHVWLAQSLRWLYGSVGIQALYLVILLSMMDQAAHLRHIFRLLFAATLITTLGAWLVPSLGPFKLFHHSADFLPVMEHLRSGRDLNFPLGALTGVVNFPSFHTTLALAMIHGFRTTGVIGKLALAVNLAMLPAIPVFGGHYVMDMIAGAGVFALSLALVRLAPRLRAPSGAAGYALPGYTPALAPERSPR